MKAKEIISNFKTKYKEGFTHNEISVIIRDNKLDPERFNNALGCHTGVIVNGECITYHCDVELGIRCCLENRDIKPIEFD